MLWHQVVRPNEQGWQGEEGESAREDQLCIFTPQGPTREKGGCVERRGGIERATCIEFRGEKNPDPETGFDQVKVQNRGHTSLGSSGRSIPKSIGPLQGR